MSITVTAPDAVLSTPWQTRDVGAVVVAGSASASSGTFTVRGAGADVWGTADAFHYVWQPVTCDMDAIARVASVEYVQAWVKAGVRIRERLTADSPHAFMLASAGKGAAFQRRVSSGGLSTSTSGGTGTAPLWVKLQRRGNTISAYRSADNSVWTLVGTDTIVMPADVLMGLAVSSHDTTRAAMAQFDNVTVRTVTNQPPPPALPTPWQAQDLGAVGPASSASAGAGTFTVNGAGADIWGAADALHFVWQRLSGDVDVVTRVAGQLSRTAFASEQGGATLPILRHLRELMRNRTAPARDRRDPARPRNGDTQRCVRCGGRSEFNERYRIEGHLVPAWVCDDPACREWDLVRAKGASAQSRTRAREAQEVRAKSSRAAMRSRAGAGAEKVIPRRSKS